MCFKGGPTTPLTSAPSARGLGILAFPEALARLVLRHAATARKTAPLQKLKRSFGLRSVRGIVVAPWRWRRVFRSATDREGPCLGPRARPPTPRRPAGPARKIHTPPPSLDPSGLIQTLTARARSRHDDRRRHTTRLLPCPTPVACSHCRRVGCVESLVTTRSLQQQLET